MTSVRRSLALSFLEKYASLVIQLGSGLVIARLITPEAFGTFAIAYAIVGFAHVIREMGVSSYLIQLPELEPHHIRAALFATGVVAWSLGLVLFAGQPARRPTLRRGGAPHDADPARELRDHAA